MRRRFRSVYFLTTYADVLVSYQWGHPVSYLHLEALYGGFPLVHNSPLLQVLAAITSKLAFSLATFSLTTALVFVDALDTRTHLPTRTYARISTHTRPHMHMRMHMCRTVGTSIRRTMGRLGHRSC